MNHSPEEFYDIQQENSSLLSTKMKSLTLNHPRSLCPLELPTNGKSESIISQLKKQGSQTNHKEELKSINSNVSSNSSASSGSKSRKLKKNNQQTSIRQKLKLFEVLKQAEGSRRSHIREVSIKRLNQFTGQGFLLLPTNKKYQGEWIDGELVGQAKIIYPNGDLYVGEVYGYQRHGRGELTVADGKYIGEFSGQDFHGYGTFYDRQGKIVYEGLWRRGKMYEK